MACEVGELTWITGHISVTIPVEKIKTYIGGASKYTSTRRFRRRSIL